MSNFGLMGQYYGDGLLRVEPDAAPEWDRDMLLPFARRSAPVAPQNPAQWGSIADVMRSLDARDGRQWQFAVPGIAKDAYDAAVAVGNSPVVGRPFVPSEQPELTENMIGHAGAIVGPMAAHGLARNALAPAGSRSEVGIFGGRLARTADQPNVPEPQQIVTFGNGGSQLSAPNGKSLPMDYESRMKRAAEQGYRLTPVYHGTATNDGQIFTAFDPARAGGRTSGSRAGQEGVSVALNPELANEFALLAARQSGGAPAVMPLLHRTARPATLRLDGTEKNLEVAATLNAAFNEGGRDAVALRNYTTPSGKTGETAVILKNPNQLRSVNAAFDPARMHEADLLASDVTAPQPINTSNDDSLIQIVRKHMAAGMSMGAAIAAAQSQSGQQQGPLVGSTSRTRDLMQ